MDLETTKSVNPFLVDDETDFVGLSSNTNVSSNPFLTTDMSYETVGTENPFLTENYIETSNLPETNPFATFSTEYDQSITQNQVETWPSKTEEEVPEIKSNDLFQPEIVEVEKSFTSESEVRPKELELLTTTTTNNYDNDFLLSSDEEASKPKKPPPPHPTLPKETHDLILSVTGALEATSHHLLDRLPPTRAPSPTSFPDFHSLSPTPDAFTDLLGTPQTESVPENLQDFSTVEKNNTNNNNNLNIKFDKVPPPRPPPARPAPARPAPPKTTNVSSVQPPKQNQEEDMFDLFGTSAPPPPKTKDAILNLYSQPKAPPKDLLTDDLDITSSTPPLLNNELTAAVETTELFTSKEESGSNKEIQIVDFNVVEPDQNLKTAEPAFVSKSVTLDEIDKSTTSLLESNPPTNINSEIELTVNEEPLIMEENPMDSKILAEEETHYIFGTKPPERPPAPPPPPPPSHHPPSSVEQNTEILNSAQPLNIMSKISSKPLETAELINNNSSFDSFDAFTKKFESTDLKSNTEVSEDKFFDPFLGSEKPSSYNSKLESTEIFYLFINKY